jgi:hypothetical protein
MNSPLSFEGLTKIIPNHETLWTFAKSHFRVNFELIFAVSPVELIASLNCFVM